MKNSPDLMEESDYMAMINPRMSLVADEKEDFEYHRDEIIWWARRIKQEELDIKESVKNLNFHISQIQALV